ncbi:MAG: DUF547 domain-containing protein [Motiliproteus sp.]
MNHLMKQQWARLVALPVLLGCSSLSLAAEPDWTLYQQLLGQHLSQRSASESTQGIALTWLDYSALKSDPRFDQLLQQLANFPVASLEGRDQQLAFYINSYNILAISLVRQHWPLKSIKDATPWYQSVWKLEAGQLDNTAISLDKLEHQILRSMSEPRIHFAIVCASLSCPDLLAEPYLAQTLDQQLDDQAQRFIANPAKGVRWEKGSVQLSKIFDWFEDDFGGEDGVAEWVSRYSDKTVQSVAGFLDYNWSVNGS